MDGKNEAPGVDLTHLLSPKIDQGTLIWLSINKSNLLGCDVTGSDTYKTNWWTMQYQIGGITCIRYGVHLNNAASNMVQIPSFSPLQVHHWFHPRADTTQPNCRFINYLIIIRATQNRIWLASDNTDSGMILFRLMWGNPLSWAECQMHSNLRKHVIFMVASTPLNNDISFQHTIEWLFLGYCFINSFHEVTMYSRRWYLIIM